MIVQIGVLLFCACIGTCLVFFSPGRAMLNKTQGMTRDQVDILLQQKNASGIPWAYALMPGLLLELAQTFIVEAFYPFRALQTHLGSNVIARGSLVIVLSNLVYGLIEYKLRTKGGTYIYQTLDAFYWFKVMLFALPTLYLWYLFAVLIGAVR
jgi:hypothetical protein